MDLGDDAAAHAGCHYPDRIDTGGGVDVIGRELAIEGGGIAEVPEVLGHCGRGEGREANRHWGLTRAGHGLRVERGTVFDGEINRERDRAIAGGWRAVGERLLGPRIAHGRSGLVAGQGDQRNDQDAFHPETHVTRL